MTGESFPVGPLLLRVSADWDGEPASKAAFRLASRAGITQWTIWQANTRQGGWLSLRQADEWAVRAGYHPYEIWGDAWLDDDAYEEGVAESTFEYQREEGS